eukprot:scaffold1457_cov350-Prasinococcus_capsulatus_cf.AAC.17
MNSICRTSSGQSGSNEERGVASCFQLHGPSKMPSGSSPGQAGHLAPAGSPLGPSCPLASRAAARASTSAPPARVAMGRRCDWATSPAGMRRQPPATRTSQPPRPPPPPVAAAATARRCPPRTPHPTGRQCYYSAAAGPAACCCRATAPQVAAAAVGHHRRAGAGLARGAPRSHRHPPLAADRAQRAATPSRDHR